jgi:hypothetical protein
VCHVTLGGQGKHSQAQPTANVTAVVIFTTDFSFVYDPKKWSQLSQQ